MATGVFFRLLWVAIFQAPLKSDFAAYFCLAKNLVEKGLYECDTGYAYWPPGYPFFLFLHFLVFGAHSWVPALANIWLFCVTTLTIYRLAETIADERIARLSTLLLVLWPNYVISAGLAGKEMLVTFLLPLAILLYITSPRSASRIGGLSTVFLTGLVVGFTSLTQPSMLLFPGVC